MDKIKVLEVIRQGQIGGGESHVLDLVDGFDKSEVEPIVLSFTGGHMIDTLRHWGVKCYIIETTRAFDPLVFGKITDLVKEENIELIHAHGSRAASNLLWTQKQTGLPMIYTVHGWSFHQDQSMLVQKARAKSEELICSQCRRVICVSESNRQTGEEMFGLSNAVVIENGINLHRFDRNGTYEDVRTKLGFKETDYVPALIARMTIQKNPIVFAKAVQQANLQNPHIRGLMIGDGDLKGEVKDFIRDNRLFQVIRQVPFRTDVPDVLHSIDLYCLPSLWEGLSIALLEAMAMAKPIVATPTDGTKEVIENEVNGLLVDFDNADQLTDAILRLYDHPDEARRYGEAAYSVIEQRFNSLRVSEAVTSIYKEICR